MLFRKRKVAVVGLLGLFPLTILAKGSKELWPKTGEPTHTGYFNQLGPQGEGADIKREDQAKILKEEPIPELARKIANQPFPTPSATSTPQFNYQAYAIGAAMVAASTGLAYWGYDLGTRPQSQPQPEAQDSTNWGSMMKSVAAGWGSTKAHIAVGWECALTELFRPRYPPMTGIEILRGDYRLMSAHLGEKMYPYIESYLEDLSGLIVNETNISAITRLHWALGPIGWVLMLDNGHTLRIFTKLAFRWIALPQINLTILRYISEATLRELNEVAKFFYNYYYLMSRKDRIEAIKAMVHPNLPPRHIIALVSGQNADKTLPSDTGVDIFEAMAQMSKNNFTTFLNYYHVWLRHYYPTLKDGLRLHGLTQYLSETTKLLPYWNLRDLAQLFDEPPTKESLTKVLELIKGYEKKEILPALDWFLGTSKLFKMVIEESSHVAFNYLLKVRDALGEEANFRKLVDSGAGNWLWLVTNKKEQRSITKDEKQYALLSGTPTIISLIANFMTRFEIENAVELFLDEKQRLLMRQLSGIIQYAKIVQQVLKDHSAGDIICGAYGSRNLVVNLNFREFEQDLHEEKTRELLGLMFIEVAFKIPRSLFLDLQDMPMTTNLGEWITGALILYCKEKDSKSTITIKQRMRLPAPEWLRKLDQGYKT